MAIHQNGGDIVPFHGDHEPVSVVQGRKSRNIFGAYYFQGTANSAVNGNLTFAIAPNNGVRINGTSNGNYPQAFICGKNNSLMHEIKPGHTYTLSYRADDNPTGGLFYFMVRTFAADKSTLVDSQAKWANNGSKTFGIQAKYLQLLAVAEVKDVTWNDFLVDRIQIEEGALSHPYEPYGTVTDPIYTPRESTKSGTELEFEESYNHAAEVSVGGKSEQKSYRGVNLLGQWEAGSISSDTGRPNQPTNAVRSGFVKIDQDKKYTLTVNIPAKYNQWRVYDEDKNYLRYSAQPNTDSAGIKNSRTGNQLFGAGAAYVRLCLEDTNETHFQDLLENQLFGVMQLEEGTVATEWEPFVGGIPSPNPDYPQPIESVESVEVGSRGRNLLDGANVSIIEQYVSSSGKWSKASYERSVVVECKPNTTYSVKFPLEAYMDSDNSARLRVGEYEGYPTGNAIRFMESAQWQNRSLTFTTSSKTDHLAMFFWNVNPYLYTFDSADIRKNLNGAMLNEGSTPKPYEPYHASRRTIDLQGHELRSLPDGTKDEVRVYRDGRVELVKSVGYHEIVGSDVVWTGTAWGCQSMAVRIPNSTELMPLLDNDYMFYRFLSTHFKFNNQNQPGSVRWENGADYRNIHHLFEIGTFSNLQAGKDWFASNDVHMQFALKEPQTIQLPSIEPLDTFYPYTFVDADGLDLSASVLVVE